MDDEWKNESLDVICSEVEKLSRTNDEGERQCSFQPPHTFLVHSFKAPGFRKEYLVGIRNESEELVGFICAIPFSLKIKNSNLDKCVEVKNLFLHPSVRGKRLTPILISEITRRVTSNGTVTAFYTSSVTITKPICKARYYQRIINVAKLVSVNYREIGRLTTIPRLQQKFNIPKNSLKEKNWRKLGNNEKDILESFELLKLHLAKFLVHQVFNFEEFKHWFVNCDPSVQVYIAGKDKVQGIAIWQVMVKDLIVY